MRSAVNALTISEGDHILAKGILKYTGLAIHVKNMTHHEWVMEMARKYAEQERNKNESS